MRVLQCKKRAQLDLPIGSFSGGDDLSIAGAGMYIVMHTDTYDIFIKRRAKFSLRKNRMRTSPLEHTFLS